MMADMQEQILPPNIRVDRNCQPTWVTQNAIPEEQELILLGGGHDSPPPTDTGLKVFIIFSSLFSSSSEYVGALSMI